jgi:hypothetical protein
MSISALAWIKIHLRPDSYPVLAGFFSDFLTDYAIIKSRKSYIVGNFFFPSRPGRIFIQPGMDMYPSDKKPTHVGLCAVILAGSHWKPSNF